MKCFAGEILTEEGFIRGYISVEENRIEFGKSPPSKPIAKGLIVPLLINAHTHVGDSFIRKRKIKLPRNVVKLVAPPNGLKHRLLREASEEEIIKGMINSFKEMERSGTSCFFDFRENGIEGVRILREALKRFGIKAMILSRPRYLSFNKDEVNNLLKESEGIGLSSVSDWIYSEIEKVAYLARKRKKIFALHASEVKREDIDLILDLKPHFLVHMLKATESDLIRVKQEGIPVVICPRSYAFFNLKLNLKLMNKVGVRLLLGTDNAMLNSCDVLEEVRLLRPNFPLHELLCMVTYFPRKALNWDDSIQGFVVLDKKSLRPLHKEVKHENRGSNGQRPNRGVRARYY
jgi:cytosine/adenosine deaminase-related metal-dependent hydrolase